MNYRRITPQNIVPIAIAEVSRNFVSLLDRVRVENTEFVIEENGQPVAVLSPVEPQGTSTELAKNSRHGSSGKKHCTVLGQSSG
jgi:antitoxin (DNA-binding transcriptional repressor) of toxin-antitoxin stability system